VGSIICEEYGTNVSWNSFNGALNGWGESVSSVEDMSEMFYGATTFNQSLDSWDVSSVKNMSEMFREAVAFNGALNGWGESVSSVEDMRQMFYGATTFNQLLDSWVVSSVKNMREMFYGAEAFNGSLNGWGESVSSVEVMSRMFQRATTFNQSLDSWDVTSVKNMRSMFGGASSFDRDILAWNLFSIPSIDALEEMFDEGSLVDFRVEWAARLEDPAWKETWRVDREERRVQRRKNENWKRRLPWMMAIAPFLRGEVTEAPIQVIFDKYGLTQLITSFL
jgi:hypothetical protein